MADFVDERSYLESFIDLLSGSSASKYQGAHETINKIMANADAKTELAKMFELKKGSKAAKRRISFCARMKGMKSKLTSSKTANDPDSRINKSLRKWNC